MDVALSSSVHAKPDVTIMLDQDGVIRSASLANLMAAEQTESWIGKQWSETLDDLGGTKIRRMLDDARAVGVSGFRQVTQRFSSGAEIPVEYATIRLGDGSGLMAIGKSLQPVADLQSRLISVQQAREQDYWKLRDVETRYRLLFDASHEALLMINAETLRVVEANPAAIRALGLGPGWDFQNEMAPNEREKFGSMLDSVRQQGRASGMLLHIGHDSQQWLVRASLIAARDGSIVMLQLTPLSGHVDSESAKAGLAVDDLAESLPDAFALLDSDGIVRDANMAFLEMVQVSVKESVTGRPLARWLSTPGADSAVLLANLKKHRIVRLFSTTLTSELGLESAVELSASMSMSTKPRMVVVLLRDVGRRLLGESAAPRPARPATGMLTEQIGKTPLATLVAETVGQVERHYIEVALGLAEGNRTGAARLLGLSRQGLYAKLSRYGFDGALEHAEEAHA